jgi:nucleoside-diphosphate-sugar epimerase
MAKLNPRKTILVTGASGFIGTHIVARALESGYEVSALSLSGSIPKELSVQRIIQADLANQEEIAQQLSRARFDYVVNCVGYVDHRGYLDGGRRVLDTNLIGLINLLSVLDNQSILRFVQIGSSDEYGTNPAPQTENMREAPISPYSYAKVAATHLLQMRNRTEGFPAVILRLFLVYGPGQNSARFLPQVISGCIEDKSFPVSEGGQERDFCYVDDVLEGIFRTLESNKVDGEVINLASGHPITIREMIDKVVTLAGGGKPQFGQVPYRSGENMSLYADITKACKLLDWKPSTDIDSGLSRTIAWYKAQTRRNL